MSYEFTLLSPQDTIGDSLSSINKNYATLEAWINSIQLSADNIWTPFVDFLKVFSPRIVSNINNADLQVQNWMAASTVVEKNKIFWLEPITIHYPFVIDEESQIQVDGSKTIKRLTQDKIDEITTWVNNFFPVTSNTCKNGVCYLEEQILIVNLFLRITYDGSSMVQISDSTVCSTQDSMASSPCNLSYTGDVANCNRSTYHCDGTTNCNISRTIPCTFPDGTKINDKSISANLHYDFINKHEDKTILRLRYIIQNCQWVYDTKI
jgi:hypothetical protein